MATVTFQVIDGVDKGRVFRDLGTPVTIGREEGNTVRLNDERVSRFHAKVQQDQNDLILTDLDSTNGTRVNGQLVQIHRLRHGDFVVLGRTVLLYGSMEEIAARQTALNTNRQSVGQGSPSVTLDRPTVMATTQDAPGEVAADMQLAINEEDPARNSAETFTVGKAEFPPLPLRLTPSQSARLAEILNFLHHALSEATQTIAAGEDGVNVTLEYATWQRILQVQMLLARYHRALADPDSWEQ
jgi:pSer/pThr/pTyr-binding forkhead associated (FHA) protein